MIPKPRQALALSLVLGLWLGGSFFMWAVAVYNFRGIGHSLARNHELARVAALDPEDDGALKTSLLWVHASELNRVYFEFWGYVQVGLGVLGLALGAGAAIRRSALVLLGGALALAIYSSAFLVPRITELGRRLDFVPRDPRPEALSAFGMWHGVSLLVDAARVLLIFGFVAVLIAGRSTRPPAGTTIE